MRRREFITLLGGAVAWPLAVRGRAFAQHGKIPRIGALVSASEPHPFADAFAARFATPRLLGRPQHRA